MKRTKTVSEETVVQIELEQEDIEQILDEHFRPSLPGATFVEVRIICGQLASASIRLSRKTVIDEDNLQLEANIGTLMLANSLGQESGR